MGAGSGVQQLIEFHRVEAQHHFPFDHRHRSGGNAQGREFGVGLLVHGGVFLFKGHAFAGQMLLDGRAGRSKRGCVNRD